VQFSVQLDALGSDRFARMKKKHYYSWRCWEKTTLFLVRDRLVFSQKQPGSLKSSYEFWGSAISSPAGSRAEPRPKSNILNTAKTWACPGFYNGIKLMCSFFLVERSSAAMFQIIWRSLPSNCINK